ALQGARDRRLQEGAGPQVHARRRAGADPGGHARGPRGRRQGAARHLHLVLPRGEDRAGVRAPLGSGRRARGDHERPGEARAREPRVHRAALRTLPRRDAAPGRHQGRPARPPRRASQALTGRVRRAGAGSRAQSRLTDTAIPYVWWAPTIGAMATRLDAPSTWPFSRPTVRPTITPSVAPAATSLR